MTDNTVTTLKRVRLELARDAEHPTGSRLHGYDFIAPIDEAGHIIADDWKKVRERCRVELCFEVLQPSELLCIHENAFFVLSHTVPRVQQEIMDAAFSHLNELLWAANVQAFYPLRKRLALLLLERTEQQQSELLRATHEDLARALRSAREMVSVELEEMHRAGILTTSRGKIRILDRPALERLARLGK